MTDDPSESAVNSSTVAGSSGASERQPDEHGPDEHEPKVSALVRGEVQRDDLDPVTVAQLAAWFGAPATGVAASPDTPPEPDENPLWRERREAHRRMEEALDEKLAHRLESWTEASRGLTRLPPPMSLGIERQLGRLDLSVWRIRSIETVETERPEDIVDCLREAVPQAVLRDLYRPVDTWPYLMLDQAVGVDLAGLFSLERIRETTNTKYQVRMERELIASQLVYRDMGDLEARLDEPWDEIEIPEEQRSKSSLSRTDLDLFWFGAVGVDPTI